MKSYTEKEIPCRITFWTVKISLFFGKMRFFLYYYGWFRSQIYVFISNLTEVLDFVLLNTVLERFRYTSG